MVYLIPIFLCLFFSVRYDLSEGKCFLGEYSKPKNAFLFIFVWIVILSALQYCVGYDIPIYMDQYKENSNIKLSDIWGNTRYRPGWLFLQFLCHKISDNFVVFKIIQAIFLNYCVYRFLSRYSKYWYLTLFFYIFYSYGQLNYGAMRQSFAVGFFLLSIPFLEVKPTNKENIVSLIKYLGLIFLATLFHTSAFLLFFVPLLRYCVITNKRMALTIIIVIISSFLLSRISNLNLIINSYIGSMEEVESNARYYLSADTYAKSRSGLALLRAFIPISFIYICLYLNRKKMDARNIVLKMLLIAYIIMATFNLFIPIFYRFNDYFVFSYIVLIPMAIYEGVLMKKSYNIHSLFFRLLLFFMFILYPINHLVSVHPAFGFPGYRIYYPYHSVFNPEIDPERNMIIDY